MVTRHDGCVTLAGPIEPGDRESAAPMVQRLAGATRLRHFVTAEPSCVTCAAVVYFGALNGVVWALGALAMADLA